MTDLRPGAPELIVQPPFSGPSSGSATNLFSSLITNIFFVEDFTPKDESEQSKEKQEVKTTKESEAKDSRSLPRVSLMASVVRPGETTPEAFTIASTVFPREDKAKGEETAKEKQPASRKRPRSTDTEQFSTHRKEVVALSLPLRRPLVLSNAPPPPSLKVMSVRSLYAVVEAVNPEKEVSEGPYKGSRRFLVRVSGVQETSLTEEQVRLLKAV